jgi:hypothetical protein
LPSTLVDYQCTLMTYTAKYPKVGALACLALARHLRD